MAKQSISGRVAQLARADLPALLERCEDPELLVDQLVADFTMTIAEAESAVAQTAATGRLLEQDRAEDVELAGRWAERATAAEADAARLRADGQTEAAARVSALAERAREEHAWHAAQVAAADPALDAFAALGSRLDAGLAELRARLELLTSQRESLVAAATASGSRHRNGHRSFDVLDGSESLTHFDKLIGDEVP